MGWPFLCEPYFDTSCSREKQYGDTADLARHHGDPTEDTGVVAGVRLMF
ncbi:MAG: copper resistance protein B [Halomonas sp.]|nr:copper resistance protein B [Halomonas sp.]